jgi:xylulokinase
MPVATMSAEEPGCLGSAILAGVGSGALPDIGAVQREWCRPAEVIEPDAGRHALHAERFTLYRELYPATRRISAVL